MGFQCSVARAAARKRTTSSQMATTPSSGRAEGRRCQNFGSMSISCKSMPTPILISHQLRQCCCSGKRSIGNPCGHPVSGTRRRRRRRKFSPSLGLGDSNSRKDGRTEKRLSLSLLSILLLSQDRYKYALPPPSAARQKREEDAQTKPIPSRIISPIFVLK